MGILMKAFVCLSLLLLFCSYIKASATGVYTSPTLAPFVRRPCPTYQRCTHPPGVGKQVVVDRCAVQNKEEASLKQLEQLEEYAHQKTEDVQKTNATAGLCARVHLHNVSRVLAKYIEDFLLHSV